MKLGVVVVTHGQLATELVNAAEMIVGDLPQFAAVSIGWHDDVERAREEIAQAIERVGTAVGGTEADPADVLILTDMFGGTPSNLGVTFVESDSVEVITGVNLPMLIKLARAQKPAALAGAGARDAGARPERHLGGVRPAARRPGPRRGGDAVIACSAEIVNPLGLHARAAARSSTWPAALPAAIRVARGSARDGRQEHHGPPAPCRRPGQHDHHHRRRHRRAGGGERALRPDRQRLRRGVMRLTGLGVSPGIGIGRALVLKQRTRELRFRVPPAGVARELERLRAAAAALARADCSRSAMRDRRHPRAPTTPTCSTPSC